MKWRLSSLEFLLSIICSLLLLCCVGLIVVAWISLKCEGTVEPAVVTGRMVITDGADFSEELRNSSSLQFKALAFDVQQLVSEVFSRTELRWTYKSCQVLYFSRGSVVVTFDLWFNQLISVAAVEQWLRAGLQEVEGGGLVIDKNSVQITEKPEQTTAVPTTGEKTQTGQFFPTVTCPAHQASCADQSACVTIDQFCDGVDDCPDASDEDAARCVTACDGQFVLRGPSGSFRSSDVSETYNSNSFCRWIIRVDRGLSVKVKFHKFETEENKDTLKLYEGVGPNKLLTAELSGSILPGTVWLLTEQSTVEFISDDVNNLSGFNATYSTSNLSNEEKLTCTFEQSMCFWRQQNNDEFNWIRINGSTFAQLAGPSFDHTLGNSSGFYIVTPRSPGQNLVSFRIYSLALTPATESMCLSFWYRMYGEDVLRLKVLLLRPSQPEPAVTVVFQRHGNYGDSWNYGQVTLNLMTKATVVFEALKERGRRNSIALDDITLTSDPCGPAPPEPTIVPPPPTMPPIPADCGGPFDLWEPNSTFSSPNYPQSYGNKAECLWTLHSAEGQKIQLHFLDFDVEVTYDMVEVRDGAGPNSTLLAVLTGSDSPTHDLFSTTNQMTVWFFTDDSGHGRGFRANFTSGVNLGSPAPCAFGEFQCQTGSCVNGNNQCNGMIDCPDASDEADCVVLQVNGSSRLQFRLASSVLTVCADTWSSVLSDFTCQYLGYRSGEASLLPALPQDSPFATVKLSSSGTLETSVSETCRSDSVISLSCDNQRVGKVVGGVNAMKGAWPWIVSLHWRGRHVCGASLISSDWLLTAAHCVYGKNLHLQFWSAVVGLHSQEDVNTFSVQTRQINRIIINRQYNRRTKQADMAMMHLQQPINFTQWIQPLCLPAEGQDITAGTKCFISGWGQDAEQGYPTNVLQEAEVPLVDQEQCQRQLPEYTITSSMLCAGYPEGGVDSCKGDSGGPLMCEDGGRWTQIGVTSFGIGCGRPQRPGVYARVSSFISWIAQTRRSSSPSSSSSSSSLN
uniref:Transmembrane serine protease 15 n=1 Tax=Monopterus albus TaxID=43700 RepID=A0A3Q3IQH3_MONAL